MANSDFGYEQRVAHAQATLKAALQYQEMGWSPIPLCNPWHINQAWHANREKNPCTSPGKCPITTWKIHQTTAATVEQILEWWRKLAFPNVGVLLGEVSGMVDIDIDGPGSLERLRDRYNNDLPDTNEFVTPSGGYRYLYGIPPGFKCRTVVVDRGVHQEIRFQAKGAQTVMPPSMGWLKHAVDADGNTMTLVPYQWVAGKAPGQIALAMAPNWLLTEVSEKAKSPRKVFHDLHKPQKERPVRPDGGKDDPIPETSRNTTLTSLAGTMRARGMGLRAITAALLATNAEQCVPPLDDAEVEKIADSVYTRYSPNGGDLDAWKGWEPDASYIPPDREPSPQPNQNGAHGGEPPTGPPPDPPPGGSGPEETPGEEIPFFMDPEKRREREREKKHDEDLRNALEFLKGPNSIFHRLGITKVIKLGKEDDADFRFVLDRGVEISLGTGTDVLNQAYVKGVIYKATGLVIRNMKQVDWGDMCEFIAMAAVTIDTPIGTSIETMAWLSDHCNLITRGSTPPVDMDDERQLNEHFLVVLENIGQGRQKNVPFSSRKGEIFLHLDTFLAAVRHPIPFASKVARRELALRLRAVGFNPCQFNVRLPEEKRTVLRLWKSQENFDLN